MQETLAFAIAQQKAKGDTRKVAELESAPASSTETGWSWRITFEHDDLFEQVNHYAEMHIHDPRWAYYLKRSEVERRKALGRSRTLKGALAQVLIHFKLGTDGIAGGWSLYKVVTPSELPL